MVSLRTLPFLFSLAFLVSCLGVPVSYSGTIEIPLLEAAGIYQDCADRAIPFDAGHAIDSVVSVSIAWSGTLVAGLGHGDGVERDFDEWFSWPGQFMARMYPDPDVTAFWYAGTPVTEGEFDTQSVFRGLFTHSWDLLLDGEGTVIVSLEPCIVLGGVLVIPPQGSIREAKLMVDFTTPVESLTWGRVKTLFSR